jgi:hypothetical protein
MKTCNAKLNLLSLHQVHANAGEPEAFDIKYSPSPPFLSMRCHLLRNENNSLKHAGTGE